MVEKLDMEFPAKNESGAGIQPVSGQEFPTHFLYEFEAKQPTVKQTKRKLRCWFDFLF
jgi:hypothetical protein